MAIGLLTSLMHPFTWLCFRYTDTEGTVLLDICTFLDPRVKSAPYLSTSEKAKVQDLVFQEMSKRCSHLELEAQPNQNQTAKSASSTSPSSSSALSAILGAGGHYSSENAVMNNDELYLFELKKYIKEPLCPMSDNPLVW